MKQTNVAAIPKWQRHIMHELKTKKIVKKHIIKSVAITA